MKYLYLILLALIAFSLQNVSGFLKNLEATLTWTSVTFSSNCVASVDDKFSFIAPFTGTATATPSGKTLTSKVTDGKSHELTFICKDKKVDDTSITCSFSSGTVVDGKYGVTDITEEEGDIFTVSTTIKGLKFEVNSKYIALNSTDASTQTINYKSTSPYIFTITYASILSDDTKPLKVIADGTSKKEFTNCVIKDAVVACVVAKGTLPIGEYQVKVVNVCGDEEVTGITLKAVEEEIPSSSFFLKKLPKPAFALFGLFFL